MVPTLLLIKISVVFAGAFGFAAALRRGPAAARHRLWSGVFVAVLLLPVLSAALPQFHLPVPARRAHAPADTLAIVTSSPIADTSFAVSPVPIADLPAAAVESAPEPPDASSLLLGVWLAGLVAALVSLGLSTARFGRLTRSADAVTDDAWRHSARAIGERLGLRRPPRILQSPMVDTPMAGGVWRPVVVVPRDALDWSDERRDIVLTHELAHVASRDPLRHVLVRLALAVYWFHPLAWLAAIRASAAREAACDEAVLAAGVKRSTYARVLLDLAGGAGRHHLFLGALPIAQRSHLERRLMTILTSPSRRSGSRTLLLAAALALPFVAVARPVYVSAVTVLPDVTEPAVGAAPASNPALASLAQPQAMNAPAPRLGEFACSGYEARSKGTQITAAFGDLFVCFSAWGVAGLDGVRPSQLPASRGRIVLETRRFGSVQQMEITQGPAAAARYVWEVNGSVTPVGAQAHAWRARVLDVIDALAEKQAVESDANNLETAITAIQNQRDGLERRIEALKAEVSSMHAQITLIRSQEEWMRTRFSALLAGSLAMNLFVTQDTINTLKKTRALVADPSAGAQLDAAIAARERRLLELQAQPPDPRIVASMLQALDLQRQLEGFDAAGKIAQLQRDIEAVNLDARVADLRRQIQELNTDAVVAALERQIPSLNTVARLTTLHERANGLIAPLRAAIAAVR